MWFFKFVFIISLTLLLTACGTKTKSQDGEELAIATQSLNQRDYDQSVVLLENYLAKNPQDEAAKKMYFSALLGSAQFESGKTALMIQVMNKHKIHKNGQLLMTLKAMVGSVPDLTNTQEKNLQKAMDFYQRENLGQNNNSDDDDLKYGTLFAYSFLIQFKKVVLSIDNVKFDSTDLEKNKLVISDIMLSFSKSQEHYKKAIEHLASSLPKVQKIAYKMVELNNKILSKQALTKYYILVIERYKPLLKEKFAKGDGMARALIAKLTTFIDEEDYSEKFLTDVVGPLKGDRADIELKVSRIKSLGNYFIEKEINDETLNKSVESISAHVKEFDIAASFLAALNSKDPEIFFDGLKGLYQSELPTLKVTFDLILEDYQNSDLDDKINSDAKELAKKINVKCAEAIVSDLLSDLDENFKKEALDLKEVVEEFVKTSNKLTVKDLMDLTKQTQNFTEKMKEQKENYLAEHKDDINRIKQFFKVRLEADVEKLIAVNIEKLKGYNKEDQMMINLMYLELSDMIKNDKTRNEFDKLVFAPFENPDKKTIKAYRRLRALAKLFWKKELSVHQELAQKVEVNIETQKNLDVKKMFIDALRKGKPQEFVAEIKLIKDYNIDLALKVYDALAVDFKEDEIALIAGPDVTFLMAKINRVAVLNLLLETKSKFEVVLKEDRAKSLVIFARAEKMLEKLSNRETIRANEFLEDKKDKLDHVENDLRVDQSRYYQDISNEINDFFESLNS